MKKALAILLVVTGAIMVAGGQARAADAIRNGGFESDLEGWEKGGNAEIVTAGAHGGAKCVKLVAPPGSSFTQSPAVTGGRTHKLSLWVKAENLALVPNAKENCVAAVWISIYDAAGKKLNDKYIGIDIPPFPGNNSDWTQITKDYNLPAEAVKMTIKIGTYLGTGTLYVDDVTLMEM